SDGEPFIKTRDEKGLVGVTKKTATIRPGNYGSNFNMPDPLAPVTPNGVTAASATISANFEGLGYTFVNPPDPNCAVGINHVIQTINNSSSSYFKIWNKAGTQVQAQMLISSLTGLPGSGDPVVVYDQLANRWLLTEFGRTPASSSFINTLILAVSVTDDPTGSWYVYSFIDNTFFVDYPKFSVWHNAYYAASNDFNTAATMYLGSSVYAFDRAKMLNGDPTATAIRTRLTDPGGRYFSMAPVCVEGTTLSSQSGLFSFFQDDQFTASGTDVDSLFIFEFTPNFAVPASSVIGPFTKMVTVPFDSEVCTATRGQCIVQQGPQPSTLEVEDLTGRLMHKVIYRKFGTHESIVANTTVDAGVNKAGIRWWELRRPGGNWGIYQEGTYSPDALHRWMAGICMDGLGNIAMVYNVSGTTAFPSIRFTGRNPCDPLGTMTLPETVLIAGTAANSSTRYGDYGTLTIDPSTNRDFWLTEQYNPATTWSTRMGAFRLNNCTPLPTIRFDNSMAAYKEADADINFTSCLKYKDYVVNVVIDAAPSQPVTVTFNSSGSATSGAGRDYTVTPASVILNAATLTQPVTIRIFNDDAVEGNESFTISYTLNNGGGNATADIYNQTCLVNIIDNDQAAVASITNVKTWGAANVATTTSAPFNGTGYTDKRTQNLYLATDMLAAGLTSGNITEFAWNFNSATVATFNNFTIQIAFTTATNLTAGFVSPAPTFTTIFSGNFNTPGVTGWRNFVLPTPVNWNGADNIIIQTCYDNTSPSTDVALLGSTPSVVNYSALVRVNTPGAGLTVCANAAVNVSASRPDIRLKLVSPVNPVATVLNTSKIANLGPNEDVYFYDGTGKVMARIKNLTAFDYGCTQVQVDRAGTGSGQFWNTNPGDYLASKSYRVIPTNNTATGHYQLTLYYAMGEVTGWQSATTQAWANAQMVKISNGFYIPDVTPVNQHVADVSVIAATQGSYGSDFTITGDFNNTGFSGFGVGVPSAASPLPVTIVYFNGYQKNNYGVLEWRTTSEYNNKGFEIEKSYDGINFSKIGFVDGAGTSTAIHNYLFTDKTKLTSIQYYRLKQVDIDARITYSNTVVLKSNSGLVLDLLSVTNPFNTTINILFTKPVTQKMSIELFDISGKKVYAAIKEPGNLSFIEFQVDARLNKGNYILKLKTGEDQFVRKLVKL
ncbi:MAG TPA: T9SS type A sorting domain-containing protein, partial [Ferruginibacter sp.]|nr:T9SS type A sorting domain-containing protein [Ferruginibacter sp.]